jgi:hypothetical protein
MMSISYRVSLRHADQPEAGGLARGRVVGLATATAFESHDEAARALSEWLAGGDGDRPMRWTGTIVKFDSNSASSSTPA